MRIVKIVVCWGLLALMSTSRALSEETSSQSADRRTSCRDSVEAFYDWYVPKALEQSDVPASDLALKYRASMFSPQLLQALREDSQAQAEAKGEVLGLDFDPFLNTQDPSEHYRIGHASIKNARCFVAVYNVLSGKKGAKAVAVPELVYVNGHWRFTNFYYGKSNHSEDENLVSILGRLRKDRRQHSK